MSDLVEKVNKVFWFGKPKHSMDKVIATVLRDMREPSDSVFKAALEELDRTESLGNTLCTFLKAYASEKGIDLTQGEGQ